MPVPKPRKDEDKDKFLSRCVSFLLDEGTDREQAVAICYNQWRNKKMPDNMMKYLDAEIKEADEKNRTFTVVGSKEVVDADGDLVKVDGMDLKRFKNNPVVLPYHDYHGFPIGKGVGKKVWTDGDKLMFKVQFATAEENPLAEQAYKLIKGGYIKTFSIGFIPDWNEIEYPEKHAKGARRIIKKAELLEISLVAVPSNPAAMLAGIQKAWDDSIFDGEELNTWEEMIKNLPAPEITEKVEKSIQDNIDAKEELTKSLREAECKIAELTLQLKEQELDSEIDEWESYLSKFFEGFDTQAASSKKEADGEHTEEQLAKEIIKILEGDK